jgi:hypothetical protein
MNCHVISTILLFYTISLVASLEAILLYNKAKSKHIKIYHAFIPIYNIYIIYKYTKKSSS